MFRGSRPLETVSRIRRVGRAACLMTCLVLMSPMGGCGIGDLADPLNNIANQIEAAITSIDINSSQWQDIVRDLQEQLPGGRKRPQGRRG